ncbi:TIGR01777 family oxidoreductase [Armatimonas sp.]|uniref:TIGR01777 family oxidoreductase n=1 Tax=Armatimonas sp. TaxID=1872638 RepID=UPI00375295AF
MKILIAGASGFIGHPLVASLTTAGHTVQTLSRTPGPGRLVWSDESAWRDAVAQADAVVNLCGSSVAAQRWDAVFKEEILSSRVEPTRKLASAHPKILLNAAAVGFYGDHGDDEISETTPAASDYFGNVCAAWEDAASEASAPAHRGRVVFLRIGQVFARGGGVIETMVNPPQVPFSPWKLGLGGPLGNGRQWVPWVHRDDVIGLITWALETASVTGPLNTVAPNPVTARQLANALGKALGKPALVSVPTFALKALVGEFADYLVASQRVVPMKALALGYKFRWPTLPEALADIVQ